MDMSQIFTSRHEVQLTFLIDIGFSWTTEEFHLIRKLLLSLIRVNSLPASEPCHSRL